MFGRCSVDFLTPEPRTPEARLITQYCLFFVLLLRIVRKILETITCQASVLGELRKVHHVGRIEMPDAKRKDTVKRASYSNKNTKYL